MVSRITINHHDFTRLNCFALCCEASIKKLEIIAREIFDNPKIEVFGSDTWISKNGQMVGLIEKNPKLNCFDMVIDTRQVDKEIITLYKIHIP